MAMMKGKNVVVTGSGTGIGRGIALGIRPRWGQRGLYYAHADDGAKSGVEEARRLGVKSAAFRADFSSIEEVFGLADEALAFLGRVDILVNISGITLNKPFFAVEPSQYNKLFDVNMRAQVLPHAEDRQGHARPRRRSGVQHHLHPWRQRRAGTLRLCRHQGRDHRLHPHWRSNLPTRASASTPIAPGWIAVENHAKAFPDYDEEKMKDVAYNAVPAGFFGLPVDIARLAIFLCSDEARFIVGQTFVCDGGSSSLMSLISDFRHESTARFGVQYM